MGKEKMVKEHILILMELSMMENGKMMKDGTGIRYDKYGNITKKYVNEVLQK